MTQSKPQTRTVEITLDAPYEGWVATMKADGITARVFIKLHAYFQQSYRHSRHVTA